MNEQTAEFLKKTLQKDFKRYDIEKITKSYEAKDQGVAIKKKKLKFSLLNIFFFALILFIFISFILIVIVYFGYVNPLLHTKPSLIKPQVSAGIEPEHITYIINELEGYKLHNALFSKEPAIIEVIIKDKNKRYTSYIDNNIINTKEGKSKAPDIRISIDEKRIVGLLEAQDLIAKVKEYALKGKFHVEKVSSNEQLALKGFYSLYNNLADENHKIKLISLLKPTKSIIRIVYFIIILIFSGFGIWYIFTR